MSLKIDLFLQVLGAGGDEHALAAEDGRREVGERLAGAGARLGEEDAARLEDVGHGRGHVALAGPRLELGHRRASGPSSAKTRSDASARRPRHAMGRRASACRSVPGVARASRPANLVEPPLVPAALRTACRGRCGRFDAPVDRRQAPAEGEDVGVVVLAAQAGRLEVDHRGGPDARRPCWRRWPCRCPCRRRGCRGRPAPDATALATREPRSRGSRPTASESVPKSVVRDVKRVEELLHDLFETEAGMIGAESDPHEGILQAFERVPLCQLLRLESRVDMAEPTVVITARGEERIRRGHLWIYRADVVDAQAAGGDTVIVRGPRARVVGQALYSDRSQIALRLPRARRVAGRPRAVARPHRGGHRFPRVARDRCDRLPPGARRGRSAAVARRRSVRRLPRRPGAVAGRRSAAARPVGASSSISCAPPASSRATTPGAGARRARAAGGRAARGGAATTVVERERRRVRGRSLERAEDRAVPRSAREPRGRGRLRARPPARLLQLQRRVCAEARPAVPRGDCGRHLRGRRRARRAQRRAQRRHDRRGARGQRVRRAAPPRARRASGSTRSCSIRPRSRRTRPRSEGAMAGYKEINLRALRAAVGPAASSSRAAARTTSTRRRSARSCSRPRSTRACTCRWSRSGCRGAIIRSLLGVPETYYLKCFILRRLG